MPAVEDGAFVLLDLRHGHPGFTIQEDETVWRFYHARAVAGLTALSFFFSGPSLTPKIIPHET
jgi:hypothetical protein